MNKLKKEIRIATKIALHNQAQRDMAKKFGWFTMMFLFWLPKYDKWYNRKLKTLKEGEGKT